MPRKKPQLRAAIYRRISSDREQTRAGVDRQLEDCLWFIEERGYEYLGDEFDYCDNDISAFSGKTRPQYERMLRDFRDGKFDIIVAWKLDRLSRSTFGLVKMIEELAPLGLRLYTDDLGEQDLSDIEGRNRAIGAAIQAENESARKSQREKRANLQRARRGELKKNTRCFGYRGNDIVEEEAEVVRAIYSAFLAGASMAAIARAASGLNDDLPIPTRPRPSYTIALERNAKREAQGKEAKPLPEDKPWTYSTVDHILRNPRYAGFVAYVPVDEHGHWTTPNSKHAQYIVRDADNQPVKAAWEAIVTPEQWWDVQRRLDVNLVRKDGSHIEKSGFPRKYIGAGIYRCSVCGRPMKSGTGSYRCFGHVTRMRDKIDQYVLGVIRARLAQPDLKNLLVKHDDGQVREIEARISDAKAEIARAQYDYKHHLIEGPLYREIADEQRALIARLTDERQALLPTHSGYGIIAADDPVAAFDAIKDVGQIATIIDFFCTVTLHPHQRGMRTTPEDLARDVTIEWKV